MCTKLYFSFLYILYRRHQRCFVWGGHFPLSLPQSHHKKKEDRGVSLLHRAHTHTHTHRSVCLQPHTELITVIMPAGLSGRASVFGVIKYVVLTALVYILLYTDIPYTSHEQRNYGFLPFFCTGGSRRMRPFRLVKTLQDGLRLVTGFHRCYLDHHRSPPDSSTSTQYCYMQQCYVDRYRSQTSHYQVFSSSRYIQYTHRNRKFAR